eukprot:GFUD01010873.1.p1 GENE.GFUD01010873.1~~GFUD01010873.1.p1  ORF type:complete len:300 (-),score=122.48 GFUD01010873.1:197-1096(-)
MSAPLFQVTIQPSSLPGHSLYPKLAAVKLEDPQLQPVVEAKGCERILANMRDCLVETHCWEKCNVEVEKFQECINTRYFEDNDKKIELAEEAVKNEELRLKEEEAVKNEELRLQEEEAVKNEELRLKEEQAAKNEELRLKEEEAVKNEELRLKDALSVDENEVESVLVEELVQDGNEDDIVDKESFRVKIVSKTDENAEVDQNLLFNISVNKPTLQCSALTRNDEGANIEISNPITEDERTKIETISLKSDEEETISLKSDEEETNSLTTDEGTNFKTNSPDDEGTSSPETDDGTKLEE